MAKSKKSKILAMALCASVMTGIYASPVMAGQISGINVVTGGTGLAAQDSVIINGVELEIRPGGMTGIVKAAGGTFTQLNVTNGMEITGGRLTVGDTSIDFTTGNTVVGGTLTAGDTTLANTTVGGTLDVTGETTLKNTKVNGTLTAGDTTVDSLIVKGAAAIDSLEVTKGIKAANGKFELTEEGVLTVNGKATFTEGATVQNGLRVQNGLSVAGDSSVAGDFAVINGDLSVSGGGLTVSGDTKLNGNLDVGAGNFKVDTAGNTEFNGNLNIKHGNFTVEAATGNTVVGGTLHLGSLDGREVGAAIDALEAYAGELKGANLPEKVGGIERNPESAGAASGDGTTTIENGAEFTETAMTMGDTIVESGKITVGAEGNQTVIEGGAITAKSLMLDGKNVGETIAGIERVDDVTTIERVTSFDANGMSIKNTDGFGTSLGVDSMEITAAGGFKTSFTAGGATFVGASGTTTINGGAIETTTINDVNFTQWHDDVNDRLGDLEYKTQNIKPGAGEGGASGLTGGEDTITVPDTAPGHTGINGNVTVGGEINAGEIVVGDKGSDNKTTIDGGNVTVNGGENGSTTINGGNITTGYTTIDGTGINTVNGNFTGDVDVDGEVTVGDGTTITGEGITTGTGTFEDVIIGDNTTIDSAGINTNDITAGTGTIGNVDMDNTGITVGDGTTITEDTVTTENIKADNGEFDSQVTVGGKTTITDGNINLGGDNGTNINADGMTVGEGTDIKDGNITVKGNEGKVEIGKGDVAIFDENGEKVTSIQHNYDEINRVEEKFDAEVNRLDNRISKVEDRVDKVGAMSAAIANLRTMGYDPAAPTEIAVGVGQYRSETGVALGMFHYPNKDFMLSLSVSTSGDEVMGGIGATWKFGRKSPEKVLAAEKEKAAKAKLAKAEAMKKAAKEAKIKAQQERHAKLAAERAAQAEAAK